MQRYLISDLVCRRRAGDSFVFGPTMSLMPLIPVSTTGAARPPVAATASMLARAYTTILVANAGYQGVLPWDVQTPVLGRWAYDEDCETSMTKNFFLSQSTFIGTCRHHLG